MTLQLADFFADHMVLQRNKPIFISGRAKPASLVEVRFRRRSVSVRAGTDGKWKSHLPPMRAGGPFTLSVRSESEEIILQDILVGEVWLCSGQSNMEWTVVNSANAEKEIADAHYPKIRQFKVPRNPSDAPLDHVSGFWQVCSPETAGAFSAVGYYFALEIHHKLKVPIGFINSSHGSSAIETWLPPEAFHSLPELRQGSKRTRELLQKSRRLNARLARMGLLKPPAILKDPGNKKESKGWHLPTFRDSSWKTMELPTYWEQQGLPIDGAVWFRKQIEIPEAWVGKKLRLRLGIIDDFDTTYLNGVKIGGIGEENPKAFCTPRNYLIPSKFVRERRLSLAVRVFDQAGSGGFGGPADTMQLCCPSLPKSYPIPLAGNWRYAIEWAVKRADPPNSPHQRPSALYNGMIHGLSAFVFRGVLWYQGESNRSRAAHYAKTFPLMIRSWRRLFSNHLLPFYFVQLAGFTPARRAPGEDMIAELRESQAAGLRCKNTGMAVAYDIGDPANIHPINKQEVGRRLASLALARTYGRKLIDSGPCYASHTVKSGIFSVRFKHCGKGLKLSGGKQLNGFAIAGRDRKFVWAKARITSDDQVEIESRDVPHPAAVRFAWAGSPETNLVNSEYLPAFPFRTDRWPMSTEGRVWPD